MFESDKLVSRKEAAKLLGISAQTLAVWASTGRYNLKFVKVGRHCKYWVSDLEAFIKSREMTQA